MPPTPGPGTLRLTDFDAPIASQPVVLRGKTVTLRAVSATESAKVREAIPQPMAPITMFARNGSVALPLPEPIVDVSDESYRRKYAEWNASRTAAEVAIGLDWVCASGKAAIDDPAAAAKELRGLFTDTEIGTLGKVQDTLYATAEEKALKNSSSPGAPGRRLTDEGATSSAGTTGTASSSSATPSNGPSC